MRLTYSISRVSGMASAVTAAHQGHAVRLHIAPDSDPELAPFLGRREVQLDGYVGEHTVTFEAVTDDLASVLDGADVLVVIAETVGQRAVASVAAQHLDPATTILLAPGGVCGALEFSGRLRGTPAAGATIAETNGLMHLGAVFESGKVTVKGVKRDLPLAFFPARADERVQAMLTGLFPDLRPVENVLVTSLANTNTIVHGPVSILSAGLIETRCGDFPFFTQAYSPGAGRLVDEVDAERVRLTEALGLPRITGREWFERFYADQDMKGETLQQMLSTFGAFQRSGSPGSLEHPYFSEDVPFGLVPLASLSRIFAGGAPTTEAVIRICSVVCGQDFWASGRTAESLGIADYSADGLRRLVEEGWPDRA